MKKSKYIRDSAERLCENHSLYNFKDHIEKAVIAQIKQENCLVQLINEIISLPHGNDGNLRISATEILGIITPPSMVKTAQKEIKKHLDDSYVRDFVYNVFQGDEEDMRTVPECSLLSINKLNDLISGS